MNAKERKLKVLAKKLDMYDIAQLIAHLQLRNRVEVLKDMRAKCDNQVEDLNAVLHNDQALGQDVLDSMADDMNELASNASDMVMSLAIYYKLRRRQPKRKKK